MKLPNLLDISILRRPLPLVSYFFSYALSSVHIPILVIPLLWRERGLLNDLGDVECSRTLLSLACGQHRVLRKIPMSKEIKSTDKFEYNPKFEDPRVRVKINQIQLKETKEENKATHEQVNQDRQFETQAAIIRIMKSQKTVTHLDLVRQTIEQTKKRGVLDMADIKKNIGRLVLPSFLSYFHI